MRKLGAQRLGVWSESLVWMVRMRMGSTLWVSVQRGGLFPTNTFQHKISTGMYTWTRGNEKSLIDYVAVDNRLRREVQDAMVVRGVYSGSDCFAIVAKVRMRKQWEFKGM